MIAWHFLLRHFAAACLAAKRTDSSGEEGRGSSCARAPEDKRKGRKRERRYLTQLDHFKGYGARRLELY